MKKIFFLLICFLGNFITYSQPTNNTCVTATTLIVGANNTQNVVLGTNVGATSSGQLSNPSCGTYQGNDIWYTTQIPSTGIISVETKSAGSNIDTAIEIYTGTCNNLTRVSCNDDINFPSNRYSKIDLSGFPNKTIYIRVWAYNNASAGSFNIVAYDPSPPAPSNNNCTTATNLVVGSTNTQNIVTGTTTNATNSGELPNPSCARYRGNDVWYTAQIPSSGIITVETQNAGTGSNIDTGLAIYTGSCGSLTQIGCDDDSGTGLYSKITLTGFSNTTVFIRVWVYNNTNAGNFDIVAYSPTCPFTTRWNGSSWNNGTPNLFTSAVIRGNYNTASNGSFEACNCRIRNNKILTINANNYISIHNNLRVNGTLNVKNRGSLVMTNDNGIVSVSGTVNVYKTSTTLNNFRDFTYWSSPVNTTISQAFSGVDPNRIFKWNTPSNSSPGNWAIASGSMIAAKGYISEAPNSTPNGGKHSVTFTGKPNNGIINIPVGFKNDNLNYTDFNLIGNPYPSAIDIDTFIQLNNNAIMDGTIWLWTHNTPISNGTTGEFLGYDYATYNLSGGVGTGIAASSGGTTPSGKVASGQGFFIRTTSAGILTFKNNMRINGQNTQLFKNTNTKTQKEKDRIWLDVESSEGGAFSQILIGFFNQATDGFDRAYDGIRLGSNWINFYSKIDTLRYAVQGLHSFNTAKKIPIGFDTYITSPLTYKISIHNIEGILKDVNIYLVDHKLDIVHDLKQAAYEFSVNGEGFFPKRFTLQFKNGENQKPPVANNTYNLIVTNQNNTLLVKSNAIIRDLKIYDITGRLLIHKKPTNKEYAIKSPLIKKGSVLIVNAIFEDNNYTSKKVLLY